MIMAEAAAGTAVEEKTAQDYQGFDEKKPIAVNDVEISKSGATINGSDAAPVPDDGGDHIIVTGADAATYLLPMRDDGESALTFRSIFIATCLSAFQAVMYQIYMVSRHVGYNLL